MPLPPDEPTDEEKQEQLPMDDVTPFTPATDKPELPGETSLPDRFANKPLDDTHPSTDTGLQPEEMYDEGLSGAAVTNEPS